jgi:hypothetical protein
VNFEILLKIIDVCDIIVKSICMHALSAYISYYFLKVLQIKKPYRITLAIIDSYVLTAANRRSTGNRAATELKIH